MIVGIDLGTTNSLVALLRDGQPITLPNELGEHLTPSAIAIAEDGATLVGRAAKDRLVTDPKAGCAFFKRDMGTDVRYRFGEREWTPTECSAAVLREMKRIAETHMGAAVREAVVSVPAYFHDTQRQATITAAKIAGLKVARIINEPTAAALAFGYRHAERESQLMVLDLGGGTFDVTVLEVFDGVVEVLASCGDSALGGEDYTDALLELVIERSGAKLDPPARARLRAQVEVAKRALAAQPAFELAGADEPVTREDLERAGRTFSARLRPIVQRCLRDARVEAADLDECLLVGGATRMPFLANVFGEAIGNRFSRAIDPDRAVALGAAVQAAACERNEAVRDVILTDVCPHTLGTEIAKELGANNYRPGYYQPIIDRNVTVPVSRAVPLTTVHPRQDEVTLKIYQGESRWAKENTYLGSLTVGGLRARPDQSHPGEIEARYSYDMNGVLEVEVTIVETGKKHSTVITSRPGALTQSEIDAAVLRLQPLKARPADLLPNRARVERATRLFAELSGDARVELENRLEQFEQALHAEDPERVRFAAAVLDDFMHPYFAAEGEEQRDEP